MVGKFSPDDLIRLALANRGYGFQRYMEEVLGKKSRRKESQLMRLFEIHRHETGIDPFSELQDPSMTRMVTRQEWRVITGDSRTPRCAGLSTSRTSKLERKDGLGTNSRHIPLPPQEFDWLDVTEMDEDEFVTGRGKTSHMFLMDYPLLLRLHDQEMMTENQIADMTGYSRGKISTFFERLRKYDPHGVADDWVRVMSFLWSVETERGKNHFEDDLMMDIRGIFSEYEKDPVNVEPPTDEDLHWVYNQLLSEEE